MSTCLQINIGKLCVCLHLSGASPKILFEHVTSDCVNFLRASTVIWCSYSNCSCALGKLFCVLNGFKNFKQFSRSLWRRDTLIEEDSEEEMPPSSTAFVSTVDKHVADTIVTTTNVEVVGQRADNWRQIRDATGVLIRVVVLPRWPNVF